MGVKVPKFRVLMRVDAYVEYEAQIEADDAQEAAIIGYDNDSKIEWNEVGTLQFDARHVVTLDKKGQEIAETKLGEG
jgi:hypothetical protein